jgi:hypothetical protein
MSELRKMINDALKEKRPNLSVSSARTYTSLLLSIYNKLEGEGGLEFFKNHEKIKEYIKTLEKPQTRKTALSSLFVLTKIESYRDDMMTDIKVVNDFYKEQRHNPERVKKLKSYEEIVAMHNNIKEKYKLNQTNEHLVELLISYLCSGVLGEELPPRRVLDYSLMKIRNFDKNNDNYISGGKMYFNQYKTKDRYGSQMIEIPKELNSLINKWKKINKSDYLLVNVDGNPFTSSSLSKKISRLFDGVSIDMLRSIFLSNYYKDMPKLKEMEELARKMSHSVASAMNFYVKG